VLGHVIESTRPPEYHEFAEFGVLMCQHQPPCPSADARDHDAARVVASFPEQGWSLLCNGVIMFEDTGELMPDGSSVGPHRGPAPHVCAAA
jgi:hypothetical protein